MKSERMRLGVIVPSSNTILEPLTQQIIASIDNPGIEISLHFARFRVTKIDTSRDADAQFTQEAMLAAAQLLADAKVDAIGWSGTAASWLGFSSDEVLCENIKKTTGIPATTSVLTMNCILKDRNVKTAGLITPYMPQVNEAIRDNYRSSGIQIGEAQSRCAGLSNNFDFAAMDSEALNMMIKEVVKNGAQTILIMCTNVAAAHHAKHWEDHYEVSVLDSVATVVYGMLKILRMDDEVILRPLEETLGSVFSAARSNTP